MALKRVTIQQIADACGLSRNTVSKVFNNRGAVPEATKKAVIQKAQELGYYQLPEEGHTAPADGQGRKQNNGCGSDQNFSLLGHSKTSVSAANI